MTEKFSFGSNEVYGITGKAFWTKILGDPVPAYNEGEFEWSLDVGQLSPVTVQSLKNLGLEDKLREKETQGTYVKFSRRQFKKVDGSPNKPIEVIDHNGSPWDQSHLIGNGSKVEVEFKVYTSPSPRKGVKPKPNTAILRVRVLELVPYVEKAKTDFTPTVPKNLSELGHTTVKVAQLPLLSDDWTEVA